MKQILITISLIFGLMMSGCDIPSVLSGGSPEKDASKPNSPGRVITAEITGGFSGVREELTAYQDGRVVFTSKDKPGWQRVISLSPSELDGLIQLFLDNRFFQLEGTFVDGQVADAFFYSITFDYDNRSNTVVTDAFGAPANLRAVVDALVALRERIVQNGLELSLRLSSDTISSGESVALTLTAANTGEEPIDLLFRSGQQFDFLVFDLGGQKQTPVWNWAHDKVFTQNIWMMTLAPGASETFQASWDGRDNDGRTVTGQFLVQGELVSTPGGRTEQQPITIASEF